VTPPPIDKLTIGRTLDLMRQGYGIEDIAVGLGAPLEQIRRIWLRLAKDGMLDSTYAVWRKRN
jgi:hypothetical protein